MSGAVYLVSLLIVSYLRRSSGQAGWGDLAACELPWLSGAQPLQSAWPRPVLATCPRRARRWSTRCARSRWAATWPFPTTTPIPSTRRTTPTCCATDPSCSARPSSARASSPTLSSPSACCSRRCPHARSRLSSTCLHGLLPKCILILTWTICGLAEKKGLHAVPECRRLGHAAVMTGREACI